jgi:hypothetical protein
MHREDRPRHLAHDRTSSVRTGRTFTSSTRVLLAVLLILTAGASAFAQQGASMTPPAISGMPRVGEILTATPGDWTPHEATPRYQWLRCDAAGQRCSEIAGATSRSAYTVTAVDIEHTLRIRLSIGGDEGGEQSSAVSDATALVPRPPSNSTPPSVTGIVRAGQVLRASNGTWIGTEPLSFQYRWQRCDGSFCMTVAQATSASYVLSAADVGQTLFVAVRASNDGGTAVAQSLPTSAVAPSPLVNLAPPAIVGVAKVKRSLVATPGRWETSGPIDVLYRWLRCKDDGSGCAHIPGATSARYPVRPVDVGRRLGVRVTAIADAGSSTRDSALTAVVRTSRPALMRPFPRVHFKGFFTPSGAVVQLMTVVAPKGARIALSCRGSHCPFRRGARPARERLRLRSLERSFRAGTKIEIRITKPTLIGKYTSILFRAGRPPTRRDRCLMPDSSRPVLCPAA